MENFMEKMLILNITKTSTKELGKTILMIEELSNATIGQYLVIVAKTMIAFFAIVFLVVIVLALAGYITSKIIERS